jgi:hypothetical protein
VLFTTRDTRIAAELGAETQEVDLLTDAQSREFLATRSKTRPLPPVAVDLIRESGRLPLALSMIGAVLQNKPPAYWNVVLDLLRNASLEKIGLQSNRNLFRSLIQMSAGLPRQTFQIRSMEIRLPHHVSRDVCREMQP